MNSIEQLENKVAALNERISELEKQIQTPISKEALKKMIIGIIKSEASTNEVGEAI